MLVLIREIIPILGRLKRLYRLMASSSVIGGTKAMNYLKGLVIIKRSNTHNCLTDSPSYVCKR
jgi:hypothetical protein